MEKKSLFVTKVNIRTFMCWGAIVTSFKLSETREWFLNYFEIQSIIHWLKLNLKFIPIRCLLIIFTPIKNIWVSWKKLNIPSQFSTQFQRVYHGIILLKYSRWFCVHPFTPLANISPLSINISIKFSSG